MEVAAPAQLVFRLARDVERWPRLLPHYVRVRAIERGSDGTLVAEMVARRPLVPVLGLGLPVAWRSRTWSEPAALRLRFVIEPTDTGSRVSIDHQFGPRVPGWAWFVDRAFTRPIASRTLATFKAIAEALAADESDTGPTANHLS